MPSLVARLAWLTGLRLVVLSLLLTLVGVFYLRERLTADVYSSQVTLSTVGASFALSALYMILLRRGRGLAQLGYAQIVIDQIVWTILAYVSGGVSSGATSFYGLTCLTGAVVAGVRGVALAATSAGALFGGMCLAFSTGLLRPPPDQLDVGYLTNWKDISYQLTLNLLVLVVVSLLAGFLVERLQRTGGQLEAARVRAEEAEQLAMLGKFAAGLAHEIRNPLGSIAGSIDLLASAPSLGEEDRVLCNIISRETARLNDLVGDMLALARPRKPDPMPLDLAALCAEVVRLAAVSGRGSDVLVAYEGPARGVEVVADAAQTRQVLWNLVRNAIQASPAGSTVTVRVRSPEGAVGLHAAAPAPVTFEVQDEGPGITDEARAQLFDAFFTTRTQGMGIGLAVVKRVVDEHGWQIDVDSLVGRGATFRVLIAAPSACPVGTTSTAPTPALDAERASGAPA